MTISRITFYVHTMQRLMAHGLLAMFITCSFALHAGMPQMNPQELAEFEKFMQDLDKPEMQQFIKEFEAEFNKLPPEVQEELNKQAMDDLKRMGIDPYAYQPAAPSTPSVMPVPQQNPHHKITPSAPQVPFIEPASDCSQVTTHSLQQASALLQNTISYLEIVRQKLCLLSLETTTLREWLSTIMYYIKMMNKPEHVKRLTSVTFTHLFDLITELETLLRAESCSLIILAGEEESRSDDPYAILGIPHTASDDEIQKAYTQKIAENDPEALKKSLEQLKTDTQKIRKRVRQAALRQATLTDAYEQLHDLNLRRQLDRYRSHAHQQQLSLRAANSTSIERLYATTDNLIKQGLIKELEDFFARYAPTELTYHQNMEEAEKVRTNEQRFGQSPTPMPTPLGGGFPYGGYQPQSYYPTSNYFPPNNYQPNFAPRPVVPTPSGTTGPGAVGAGAPQAETKNAPQPAKSSSTAPTKETKSVDASKKATKGKSKKKKPVDGIEQITKEFTKHLSNLKEPMNNFKDYIQSEEQAGVRTLDMLAEPLTRAGKSITDECFKPLHEGLKRHINPEFINKFEVIRKFIVEKLIPNQVPHQKAIDACRSVWEKHHKDHSETYKIITMICKHVLEAVEKNRLLVQQIPWNNVLTACQTIEGMKELFKKPQPKNDNGPSQKQKDSNPLLPLTPSMKERDQKIKEKEKKEKAIPTVQEIQSAVQAFKAGCDIVEKNMQQPNVKVAVATLRTSINSALASNNAEEVAKLKTDFDELLVAVGFTELAQLQSTVKKMHKALPASDKQVVAGIMKVAKVCKKAYPALYEIQTLSKAIKEFLR